MADISLGQFLKQAREDRGFTLREVELETDISNSYLSQLEGEKIKHPSPMSLYKLAETYGVSYTYLMELAGYPVPSKGSRSTSHSGYASRIGAVTPGEEDALIDYLRYIRSRSETGRRKRR